MSSTSKVDCIKYHFPISDRPTVEMWIPAPYSLCVNFWEIVASEKPRTDWHNSKQWPLFNIKVTTELVERIAAAAKRSTPAEKKALSEEVYHSVLEEVPNW